MFTSESTLSLYISDVKLLLLLMTMEFSVDLTFVRIVKMRLLFAPASWALLLILLIVLMKLS